MSSLLSRRRLRARFCCSSSSRLALLPRTWLRPPLRRLCFFPGEGVVLRRFLGGVRRLSCGAGTWLDSTSREERSFPQRRRQNMGLGGFLGRSPWRMTLLEARRFQGPTRRLEHHLSLHELRRLFLLRALLLPRVRSQSFRLGKPI